MSKKVLFFSRGRGHGHAIPDLAIVDSVRQKTTEFNFTFISYATGAATFRKFGRDVIDLDLPENNPFIETLSKSLILISQHAPDAIIAHEEFAAIAACGVAKIPSLFLSAWLPPLKSTGADALRYAHSVIVLEQPGIFPVPPWIKVPIRYVGAYRRTVKHTANQKSALRGAMGISATAKVIVVHPGGSSSEGETAIADLVISAFLLLDGQNNRLFWLSTRDAQLISERFSGVAGVEALSFIDPVESLLAIADIIVTKATRGATLDAELVGVPSISISHGRNPIDDTLVARIHNNIALNAYALTSSILFEYFKVILKSQLGPTNPALDVCGGPYETANAVIEELNSITYRDP